MTLVAETDAEGIPELPAADILLRFQSLGDNCEFGLVQRYCGTEPLGLFRFTMTPTAPLIAALDADFRDYGTTDDLTIIEGPNDFLYCVSRRYGFSHSTNETVGTVDPERVLAREVKKLDYLKRRMLEDLAAGDTILVRKGPPDDDAAFRALARAVWRHGPSTLLHVRAAGPSDAPGSVRWSGERVMEGFVRRFAPYTMAIDVDLEPWLDLCRNAFRLATALPAPAPPAQPCVFTRFPERAQAHAAKRPERDLAVFTTHLEASRIAQNVIHVFSAWVWLPADCPAMRVFAAIDHHRLAWHDADLAARETWQRVWISAKVPRDLAEVRIGLAANGLGRGRFWSTDWRLDAALVPPPAQPPSIRIGRGLGAWLSSWKT